MAYQQKAKKVWTKPVLRRLDGAEAERMRALMMERSVSTQEPLGVRKAV